MRPTLKALDWRKNFFLRKSIIYFDEFRLNPEKIMVWYNVHGNRVNLITLLTKQIFSPLLVFMKRSSMGCCRCWGNGIDLPPGAWNFHIFPWSHVETVGVHVIVTRKIGQTNEISRYVHTWPWQNSSNSLLHLLIVRSNLQCHRDSITEAQAEASRENENVNVSRVLHWSR